MERPKYGCTFHQETLPDGGYRVQLIRGTDLDYSPNDVFYTGTFNSKKLRAPKFDLLFTGNFVGSNLQHRSVIQGRGGDSLDSHSLVSEFIEDDMYVNVVARCGTASQGQTPIQFFKLTDIDRMVNDGDSTVRDVLEEVDRLWLTWYL